MVLLVGALLRLAAFQEALIGADQSSILAAAADIAALRDMPGVGIKSSVGVMQTAVPAYLAALPLLLVHRVIAVKWFYAVLDILAIAVLHRAVQRAFGRRAAAVAALLYATNPWVIEYNRWIWYQSLIPTFATLAFAALLSAASRRRGHPLSVAGALVSATLMGLVHLAALPWAGVVAGVAILIAARRRWWRQLLIGFVGALIVAGPYLVFLAQGGIADVEILLGDSGEAATAPLILNTSTYRLSAELLTGREVLATPRNPQWEASVLNWEPLYVSVLVLLALAAGHAVYLLAGRRRAAPSLWLALLWSILAPTIFLLSDIHLQHFYLLFIFPAPFVLIGVAAGDHHAPPLQSRWLRRIAAVRSVGVLLAVVLLSAWWTHLWIVRIGYEQRGMLRAPTRAWLMDTTVERIEAVLDTSPSAEVIIITHFGGEASPFDWIRNFVGSDRVRVVPAGGGLIVPAAETCYLVAERASAEQLAPMGDRVTLRPEMTVPASPPWTFHCAPPRPALPEPLATWENGLSLIAADVEGGLEAGAALQIKSTWHYRDVSSREYHFFNHLMAAGSLVGQIDGDGIPTRYWRDDDLFVTYFTLPLPETLPPGQIDLRVGAYTWPEVVRVHLVDGSDAMTVASWLR